MIGRIILRLAAILRSPLTLWVGVYAAISSPFLASLILFVGMLWFVLLSWVAYSVWSIVFYRLLSNRDAIERARNNLSNGQSNNWFWRVARFIQTKVGVLMIYFFFLTLGPVFSVPLVKVSGRGNLKGDLPVLLIGSLLAAPPLFLMTIGLVTFTPIPHWIWELLSGVFH